MRSENVVLLPFDLVGLESRDHTSPISSSIRIQEIPMVVQTREVANNNLQTWGRSGGTGSPLPPSTSLYPETVPGRFLSK